MYPIIPLYDIVKKWRDKLAQSPEIVNYCQEKYGKAPTIYVGVNLKKPPTENDCPYIVILPGASREGETEQNEYVVNIGWAIRNDRIITVGNIQELAGIAEVSKFGELILDAVVEANPSYPVTQIITSIEPVEFFPQLVGEMELTIEIDQVIGATISY